MQRHTKNVTFTDIYHAIIKVPVIFFYRGILLYLINQSP